MKFFKQVFLGGLLCASIVSGLWTMNSSDNLYMDFTKDQILTFKAAGNNLAKSLFQEIKTKLTASDVQGAKLATTNEIKKRQLEVEAFNQGINACKQAATSEDDLKQKTQTYIDKKKEMFNSVSLYEFILSLRTQLKNENGEAAKLMLKFINSTDGVADLADNIIAQDEPVLAEPATGNNGENLPGEGFW